MFWLKIKQKQRKQTWWKFQDENRSLFSFHFNGTQTWNTGCISFWTGEDTGRGESRYLMTWKVNGGFCSAYTDIPVPVTCRWSNWSSTCLLGHLDSPKDPGPLKNARHLRFLSFASFLVTRKWILFNLPSVTFNNGWQCIWCQVELPRRWRILKLLPSIAAVFVMQICSPWK